jgi:hypothetical protein
MRALLKTLPGSPGERIGDILVTEALKPVDESPRPEPLAAR